MQQVPSIANIFKLNRGTGSPRGFQDNLIIFLFLLPAIVIFLVFVVRDAFFTPCVKRVSGVGTAMKLLYVLFGHTGSSTGYTTPAHN